MSSTKEFKPGGKTIKLLVNLYHHYPDGKQTNKYTIPFKKRSKRVTKKESASGIYDQQEGDAIDGLAFIKDNYDKLREIYDAGDDMIEVQQAMGGFIRRFFKDSASSKPKYGYRSKQNYNGAGFDGKRYAEHKGGWTEKPITEFKKLFD